MPNVVSESSANFQSVHTYRQLCWVVGMVAIL